MKVLLLNPPGKRNYLRDYYCTTVSKSSYYYHPVDLLYLSGTLSLEHDVHVIDALARGLTPEQTLKEIGEFGPEVLVSLVAAPSFDEDHAFLSEAHNRFPPLRIVGTGDVFREFGEKIFEMMDYLEATLVDFSTDDLLRYLRGPKGEQIENVIYKPGSEFVIGTEHHGKGSFSIPAPLIDLFPAEIYSFPFVRQEPFMTVLSDFGCAYGCTFCPISTLGFKLRPVSEVIEELKNLWKAGYREVHFRDQTFAVDKKRTLELCAAIKKELPDLTWSCFSRVDVLDEERVRALVDGGCHTVIVGIEFDDDALQKILKKNIDKNQMFDAVNTCRRFGMRVAGTFILGLPEQDEASILKTGELARALDLDFASFNLATPRLGTTWRKKLLEEKSISEDKWKMDTVEGSAAFEDPAIDRETLERLRTKVQRDFYVRPGYVLKRLFSLRSFAEARSLISNGLAILRG